MVEKTKQHKNDYYFTYVNFAQSVIRLANKIRDSKKTYRNIYAIPRGGLMLGVALSHELDLPLSTDTIMEDTLIVDDICDTGRTMRKFDYVNKVALITKPKGLNVIKNLTYDIQVEDDTWVHFPWEKK